MTALHDDAILELPAPGRTGARGKERGREWAFAPRQRRGDETLRPDRRLIRPETGWPGHETELSSLRYRAVHWIRIRGAPESKSEERTLEEGWRATEKLPQRLGVVDGGHVACGSTGRFATMLGRFWRSCGGIDSSCVTPAADCGVGVHCLAGSNSSISVISRVMGQGI